MADAVDVARLLTGIGYDMDCPDESALVCPARLQKLLYYCQGWSLALLGRPLFHQPIEACENGPVVRDVDTRFVGQRGGITPDQLPEPSVPFTETETAIVRMVWREYAKYPPAELTEMARGEPAWAEARRGIAALAHPIRELAHATMAAFFTALAKKSATNPGVRPIDPCLEWRAEDEWEKAGKPSISLEDLMAELLPITTRP